MARSWRPCRSTYALLLALLVLLPTLAVPTRAEDSSGLSTFSEGADCRVYPWIAPVLRRLGAELEAASAEIHARAPDVALGTWGAYGSGFLRYVQRGRDLDCLAIFDLGVVRAGEEAPEQAIRRVEAVLGNFAERRLRPPRGAALATWDVDGLTPEGRLQQREKGLSILGRAFAPGARHPLSVLLPHEAGGHTATRMDVGEVPLPTLTSVHYLSNMVRYRSGMPAALREISLLCFFAVRIQGDDGTTRRFVLTPSFERKGRPVPFQEHVFFAVFPSQGARDRFAAYLHPEYELLCGRMMLGGRLLRAARVRLADGYRHKALRRMHQVLDLMAPVYDTHTRRRIACDLSRWLDSPSSRELDDLEKVARLVGELKADPVRFELYRKAGTLGVIEAWFGGAVRSMTRQYPGHAEDLRALASELSRLVQLGAGATAEEWAALARTAATLAEATAPHEEPMRADLRCLEAPFLSAGWRFLPVVDASEDEVLLSAENLPTAQVPRAALTSLRYGRFAFRAVAAQGPPRAQLALPVMRGAGEQQAFACWRSRLARVDGCLRWRVGCARWSACRCR